MGYCTGCGAPLASDAHRCVGCGLAIEGGPPGARAGVAGTAASVSTAAPAPRASIDVHRLGVGDLLAGGATALLCIMLFLPWYSVQYEDSDPTSVSALSSPAGGFRILLLIGCLAVLGYLFARTVMTTRRQLPLPHWQLLTALTGVNAFLALVSVLVRPAAGQLSVQSSLAAGAVLGLLVAAAAVAGAVLRRRQPELVDATTWSQWRGQAASQPTFLAASPGAGHMAAAGALAQEAARTVVGSGAVPGQGCTSCGAAVPPGNRFCVSCGSLVP